MTRIEVENVGTMTLSITYIGDKYILTYCSLGLTMVRVLSVIRAKRVSNCYIQKKKSVICACVRVFD